MYVWFKFNLKKISKASSNLGKEFFFIFFSKWQRISPLIFMTKKLTITFITIRAINLSKIGSYAISDGYFYLYKFL